MDPVQIGPYRILGRLGEGAMGVVYRAIEPTTGRAVAVKTARAGESTASNLRSELRALARVQDPRIVRVLGFGATEAGPYFAMEFIEGRTWQAFNRELWSTSPSAPPPPSNPTMSFEDFGEPTLDGDLPSPPPSWSPASTAPVRLAAANGRLPEVLTLVRKLCPPLALFHGLGLVHRDLKPANVIIGPDGTPVIMDLGVVSRFRGAVGRERIEVAGTLVGTVAYMAPEQAKGMRVDARADLYSLGCMLYESVTGRLPLTGPTLAAMLARVISDPPEPPSTLVDGVPPELEDLILRLLQKDPRKRIGFAEDVALVLDRLGAVDDAPASPARSYLYRPELVGREEHLRALEAAVTGLSGGKGAMILVGGESGVGKTFLASEAARAARLRRIGVVLGECLPSVPTEMTLFDHTGASLHPFRPLLTAIADRCRLGGAEVTSRLLGPHAAVLAPFEPTIAALAAGGAAPVDLPAELARPRVLRALRDVLSGWVQDQGPQLVILDDLQWADELSIAFLRSLGGDWLSAHGVMVLGTWRTEEADAHLEALVAERFVHTIRLERLDATRVRSIVSDMLAMSDPPAEFIESVTGWSEGNPFFVAEYLRMAAAEGFLRRRAGRWEFAGGTMKALPAPNSVRELVTRRLAGLPTALRGVLDAAAVLGRELPVGLLAAVLRIEVDTLGDQLRELETRQVLEAVGADHWRFVHDKLRETVYNELDVDRRRALHRQAGWALENDESSAAVREPRVLARHWREAEEWARSQHWLERAGEEALRNYANEEAIACFEEVEALQARLGTDPGDLRAARWSRALGEAWLDAGDQARGQEYVGRALQLLGSPALPSSNAALAVGVLGQVLVRVAQSWFPTWFVEKRPDRQRALVDAAHLYNRLLEPKMLNNEVLLGLYCGLRNVNLAERTTPSPAMARGFGMMSAIVVNTPLKGVALRWADRAVAVAEGLGSPEALSYALHRSAVPYFCLGRWEEALRRFGRSAELAERDGDRRRLDEARAGVAIARTAQGRWAETVAMGRDCLESSLARGDAQTAAWSRACLIEALARLGREREAEVERAAALGGLSRLGDGERFWLASSSALSCLLARDPEGAEEQADAALAIAERSAPVGYFIGAPLGSLAEVYVRLWTEAARDGRADAASFGDRAGRAIGLLEAYVKQCPFAGPFALVWRGSWHHQRGAAARAQAAWAKATSEAERLDMRQILGAACFEAGSRAQGAERQALLTRAAEAWQLAGAQRDRARALGATADG